MSVVRYDSATNIQILSSFFTGLHHVTLSELCQVPKKTEPIGIIEAGDPTEALNIMQNSNTNQAKSFSKHCPSESKVA